MHDGLPEVLCGCCNTVKPVAVEIQTTMVMARANPSLVEELMWTVSAAAVLNRFLSPMIQLLVEVSMSHDRRRGVPYTS